MTSVADVLSEATTRYERVYFRPGLGNAGDALIAAGFYAQADRIGLDFTELPGTPLAVPRLTKDDLVILTGGSWLATHWDFGTDVVESLTRFDPSLLLLPQSLYGNEGTLRRLRPQDTLFTRERYSHEFAQSLGLDCRIELDDDMAIHLDPLPLLDAPWQVRPRTRQDIERLIALARLKARASRHPVLQAWRVDNEASGEREARWRDDLSLTANFGTRDRHSIETSAGWLMRAISWYERVETDRLHVGIGAALLGTPVTIHTNSYYKIRGI